MPFILDKYIETSLYNKFSAVKKDGSHSGLHGSAHDSDPKKYSHSHYTRSLNPHGFLLIHVGEHEWDVTREQVVHLVAEGGFAQQLGASHQISDCHMEVRVTGGPVRNAREWVRHQNILKRNNVEVEFDELDM